MTVDSIPFPTTIPLPEIDDALYTRLRGEYATPSAWPSMVTIAEQALYHAMAARSMTGSGAMVELGCWMGASTRALARGLSENERISPGQRRLHVYDRFVWDPVMSDFSSECPKLAALRSGDCFLEQYKESTAPYRDQLTIHAGDLKEKSWTGGQVDPSNSWSSMQ